MKTSSLSYVALGLVITFGALHFVAEKFYLYWTLWWFDNLIHLVAGFAGGLVIVWLLFASDEFNNRVSATFKVVLTVVASVLVVGIAWEIFEYVNKITQTTESYALDTSLDLLFDVLGAVLASVAGVKRVFGTRR